MLHTIITNRNAHHNSEITMHCTPNSASNSFKKYCANGESGVRALLKHTHTHTKKNKATTSSINVRVQHHDRTTQKITFHRRVVALVPPRGWLALCRLERRAPRTRAPPRSVAAPQRRPPRQPRLGTWKNFNTAR